MANKDKQKFAVMMEYLCVIAVILIALVISSQVNASEQKISASGKVESVGRLVPANSEQLTTDKIKALKQHHKNKAEPVNNVDDKTTNKPLSLLRTDNAVVAADSLYFSIHSAESYLVTDIDQDGYYQEFGVRFDADTEFGSADVYAEMYLSLEGGPWQHYYSSDVFTIYGDSLDDQYEVVSTLVEGFPPGSYDVLIDLYEVGVDGVVASFSSDDTNSLYGLPLEDSSWDEPEVIIIVEDDHGGSVGWGLLSVLIMLAFRRKITK